MIPGWFAGSCSATFGWRKVSRGSPTSIRRSWLFWACRRSGTSMADRFCSEMTILSRGAAAGLALLTLWAAGAGARAAATDDTGQKAARRQEEEARLQKVRAEIESL